MRFLVIGSGGREHAICWKLAQEGIEVCAAPGNPGIERVAEVFSMVSAMDSAAVLELAKQLLPDCIVVGPEDPLIAGLADLLREAGFAVFGPNQAEAMLEGSKAFSKRMMEEAGVPTAEYQTFTNRQEAKAYAQRFYDKGRKVAVKASGAALGKGVVVAESLYEAQAAIDMMMLDKALGSAGDEVVIEEKLVGREFSLLTIVSGQSRWSLPIAQDHKRIGDGDTGLNTGGMGAYSPVSWVPDDLVRQSEAEIVDRLLACMASEGRNFSGCLFSGIMVQDGRPYCLEYNVRFGDPECQTVLRRIGSGFGRMLLASAKGEPLSPLMVDPESVVTLSLCSGGYPLAYEKGFEISFGQEAAGVEIFHAGTRKADDGKILTNGGRVLSVTAKASTLAGAREMAYKSAASITFEGKTLRRDIASQ